MRQRLAPRGLAATDLLVVLGVLVLLSAVLLPVLLKSREAARQAQCAEHLRQIGVAHKAYVDAQKVFVPGQFSVAFKADAYGRYVNPEEPKLKFPNAIPTGNAAGPGYQGTSWVVHLLPGLNQAALYNAWNFTQNVRTMGEVGKTTDQGTQLVPKTDLAVMYCPSRRTTMMADSRFRNTERVDESWRQGGNDYAAMTGSGITFQDADRQTYWLSPMQLAAATPEGLTRTVFSQSEARMGVFGVNSYTRPNQIKDGVSNVILVSERRIFEKTTAAQASSDPARNRTFSSDGWAFGGPATLLSARNAPRTGIHFDEADSAHHGGVQVCMADGSVRRISVTIDLRTWENLGNIAQGTKVDLPPE